MNYTNLIIGVFLLTLSIIYLIFTLKRTKKIKKGDSIRHYNFIKIYTGILVFIIIAFILIFGELKYLL